MTLNDDQILQKVIDIIIRTVSPVQVILFGSRASGSAHEGSDYDLIVVTDNVVNERVFSGRIHRALLAEGVKVPVDVIVVDRARFARHRNRPGTVYCWGHKDGEVVYG